MVSGVAQLRPEDAMVEAMLRGWRAQQAARGLREETIAPRERLVRRFLNFTNEYPWRWMPSHVDEWFLSMTSESRLAHSTIRGYQVDLRLFTEFLVDNARYGWVSACETEFGSGVHPVPIVHEWNSIAHLQGYEGNPEARPFTREELQRFIDYADDQVDRAVRAKRKGVLAAYRDATLFKVMYGWGLFSRGEQVREEGKCCLAPGGGRSDASRTCATRVVHVPVCRQEVRRALSCVMSSRLAARAASSSWSRSSSCKRRSTTC